MRFFRCSALCFIGIPTNWNTNCFIGKRRGIVVGTGTYLLYQVRVGLRVSPKVPVQIEASVVSGSMAARAGRPASMASLIGGLAASRPFQIMYRNEEVTLRDIIHFRAHLLVDSRNLKDSLERAEWSLGVELWCGEGAASSTLAPVACRVLKLHFQPSQGLHYHLPVLFDYFHLAAVSITIHASLVALHQPYINAPRSSKQWGKLVKNAGSGVASSSSGGGTLESVLFGSGKCGGGGSSKIAHARQVHAEVCGILLGSLEGLQNALNLCGSAGTLLTPDSTTSNSIVGEVAQRLKDLSDFNKRPDTAEEEEFACGAANDIARLCAEVTLRWRSFLQATSDRPHVHHALAVKHHALRIKRFAECFFVLDNPRHSLAGCYDSNYQSYQTIGDAARRSRYLALLPPLPVHCIALDGDPHIMPIIFEDRYQDTAEFARRRSVLSSGTNKSGSDPFLCSEPLQDDCGCSIASVMDSRRPSSEASRVTLTLPKTLVLEPKLNPQKQNVVKATLTLAPQTLLNGSPKRAPVKRNTADKKSKLLTDNPMKLTCRNRYIVQNNQISEIQMPLNYTFKSSSMEESEQLSRFTKSTLLNVNTKSVENIKVCGTINNQTEPFHKTLKAINKGVSTLPARHSKSLDQLKISQRGSHNTPQFQTLSLNHKSTSNSTINCHNSQLIAQQMKPTTLPRSVTTMHTIDKGSEINNDECSNRTSKTKSKEEEYRRNINEFREKYKNPCGANLNIRNMIGELIKTMDTNKLSNSSTEVLPNSANELYRFEGGNQGNNKQLNNFIHTPLEFQRSYAASLPRPMLPPRNSFPPVSGKNQYVPIDQSKGTTNKHIQRSNSSHAFHQNNANNHQTRIDLARNQICQEIQSIIQQGLWSNIYDASPVTVHETKSLHQKNKDLSRNVDNLIESSICNTKNITPPLMERVAQSAPRHKRNKLKDVKQHPSTKLSSRQLNASKESLSSRQSNKSRDSKSDRVTPKSEKGTPKSDRGTPKSDKGTPKSDKSMPKSDSGQIKVDKSTTKNEKKCKHRVSEKMSQLISEVTSSSSNDSIPFALKRLESSASVPQRLDRTETLRHCRSAASVLDEQLVNSNLFSESLPNLAPPAAFGSPTLDIADNEFRILPPDIFKNECDRRYIVSSTSSLSEQSGWVSSARTSEPSTPELTHVPVRNIYNTYPNPAVSKALKLQEINAVNIKDVSDICDKNTSNLKRTVLNGEQLREKLLKLAVKVAQSSTENVECCNKLVCQECEICSDSICTDSQCEFNRIQKSDIRSDIECTLNNNFQQKGNKLSPTLIHNSFSAGHTLNSKTQNCFLNGFTIEPSIKKSQTITEKLHPYIRKEMPTNMSIKPTPIKSNTLDKSTLRDRIEYTEKLLAAEIRSLTFDRMCRSHNKTTEQKSSSAQKYQNKCRSEIDLAHYTVDNEYEHLKLPPPQQFRDIPPPPDEFKDPPAKTTSKPNSKSSTPRKSVSQNVTLSGPLQLDNPLYHVCEGILERRQMRPLQSSASSSNTATLNKSQSTGELASRNENDLNKGKRENDLVSIFGLAESERLFVKCRDEFRASIKYSGALYSDFAPLENPLPYFHISDEYRMFNPEGLHLIICVHGLDGNAADLRLVKTYLELGLPGARLDFLMSERNQGDTFSDFDTMTERLVQEILHHIQTSSEPARISFIGHSLGTIIIRSALARPQMKPLLGKLHTFLSLSGPHLGTLYNSSGLVNAGMWFMQKWKKSGSLLQLSLRDASDPRRSFLYRLSERSQLHQFKHVLLCGSGQDRYVPLHSARLELCKAAAKDTSLLGQAYREMVHNMVSPLAARSSSVSVVRYDVQHALPHTASALVGRAAHIAALDSDLFIEKFLLVSALKYFR